MTSGENPRCFLGQTDQFKAKSPRIPDCLDQKILKSPETLKP